MKDKVDEMAFAVAERLLARENTHAASGDLRLLHDLVEMTRQMLLDSRMVSSAARVLACFDPGDNTARLDAVAGQKKQ